MMRHKPVSLLSVAVLLLSIAGCATAPASATPNPAFDENPYNFAYKKYTPDEIVMTIDGYDVTWEEYFFFAYSMISMMEANIGAIEEWDVASVFDASMTNAELVSESTKENLVFFMSLAKHSNEEGLELSDDDLAELESIWESNLSNFEGDEESLLNDMATMYMTKELYNKYVNLQMMMRSCYAYHFGADGSKFSDEDAMQYAQTNGYIQAMNILIQTLGEDGEDLPENEKAAKLKLTEDILNQINAADEPSEKYHELMEEYNEDPGMLYYTSGYVFTMGHMVPEFYFAASALSDFGISEIVESSYGYHIIMRVTLDLDAPIVNSNDTIRNQATQAAFDTMLKSWMSEADVVFAEKFVDLDMAVLLTE